MEKVSIKLRSLLLGITIATAVVAVGSALFTTIDHVSADGQDCGSPISPESDAARCEAELGHARATRTAALAWTVVLLGAGWGGAALTTRRSSPG